MQEKKNIAPVLPHFVYEWNVIFVVQNVPRAYIWYFYGPMLTATELAAAEK